MGAAVDDGHLGWALLIATDSSLFWLGVILNCVEGRSLWPEDSRLNVEWSLCEKALIG